MNTSLRRATGILLDDRLTVIPGQMGALHGLFNTHAPPSERDRIDQRKNVCVRVYLEVGG